jgi:hypothetical protein
MAGHPNREIQVDSDLEENLSQIIDAMPNLVKEAEEKQRQELDKAKRPELTRIAQLILQMDARAISSSESQEMEIKSESRRKLAASLGCTADDLQSVVDSYGEDHWQEMVLEERVRHGIASTDMRDISWDRLESATLKKLLLLVDANKVGTVQELLQIATAANKANRGQRSSSSQGAGGFNVQQNNVYLPGSPADGVLPGGNLGKIHLNLGPRVVRQIEASRNIDMTGAPEFEGRKLDSIEMLDLKQVQQAITDVETQK